MNRQTFRQRVRQMLAPVAVALATVGKWLLPAIKFGLPLLKMGGFMFFSLFIYAQAFGWAFAAGFIVLLFIHEMGHLLAAKAVGLKVSLPLFIPFLGAMIAMREAPRNAWIEAIIGIGGPLLGSLGALCVASCYFFTGNQLFLVLGYVGCFLNLFNLIPVVPLDGGRIVSAISPRLWLVGILILVPYLGYRALHGTFLNSATGFVIIFIVLSSLPRVLGVFRKQTPAQMRYFECTPSQRWTMAGLYFSLMIALYLSMVFLRSSMRGASF
jgi:Zn-dependent protease